MKTITTVQKEVLERIKLAIENTVLEVSVETNGLLISSYALNLLNIKPILGDYVYFKDDSSKKRFKVLEVTETSILINQPEFTVNVDDVFMFISVLDKLVAGSSTDEYASDRYPIILLDMGKGERANSVSLAYLSYLFPLVSFENTNKFENAIDCRERVDLIETNLINYLHYFVKEDVEIKEGYFLNGIVSSFAITFIEVK